jgi:hypothetical protein
LLGRICVRFPLSATDFAEVQAVVTSGDCPAILGLKDMQRLNCTVDTVQNVLKFSSGVALPLVRERGHLWLRWTYAEESLFTLSELTQLHARFGHPSPERLAYLLKRAEPNSYEPSTLAELRDIAATCGPFTSNAPKPRTRKVSVPPSDPHFNRVVTIDITYIGGKPVMHVVEKDTSFQAGGFLIGFPASTLRESARAVWNAVQRRWVLPLLGLPDAFKHDQGSAFVAEYFQAAAAAVGVTCLPIAVEAANQMGSGERYHGMLRRIFNTLSAANLEARFKLDDDTLLQMAFSAINDTAGPAGIVPTILVFGAVPKLPAGSAPAATAHSARVRLHQLAISEYSRIIDEKLLQTARSTTTPMEALS